MQRFDSGMYMTLDLRIVGALRPVAAAVIGRADVIGLADLLEHDVLVHRDEPLRVDPGDEVLLGGRLRPQELAVGGIEAPGDAGLARDAGQRLARPAARVRIDRQHAGAASGLTGVLMIIISKVHS